MNQVKRLFDIPYHQLSAFPNKGMFVTKKEGEWIPMSTQSFLEQVNALSRGLVALGVTPGQKVAIVSPNRVEWNLMDIAILQIGGVVVPVYPNISEADYKHIFNDAGIRFGFIGTKDLYEMIWGIREEIPALESLFCFDEVDNIPHYKSILEEGTNISTSQITALKANVRNEDMATIIYTSGTTGKPKGVMLSHNNLISNVLACSYTIPADQHSNVLTFLPACHVYERMLHYLYMYQGSSIHFAESMDTIGDNIREVKPEVFTAVPRLLEKVFDRIMAKGYELKGIKRFLFFWAIRVAEQYDVKGKSAWYKFKLAIARKLIFSKWKEALGGRVRAVASGSAALQPRLAQIFLAAGINILEGYGLTETSPVISVNCLKRGIRIGTVGPLIEGVKVKLAEDGEILVKGPNVMMGYYNLPDKTAEVIDAQGWFHTGDIGTWVDEQFLKITDRKKEIFKTSGGKYIVPQAMENKFKESRFIEQMMVVGENQKFPAALIVPPKAVLIDWARAHNVNADLPYGELLRTPEIVDLFQKEVDKYNELYGSWEKIKKFALLENEFAIDTGELTPTLKLKRKIIIEKYQSLLDGFYQGEE
ncbi:MAG: AMP-dependent synthetase [Candidatus Fluviicola riflensis]|nr:MAG: long-chain fatty acid--CoA ligase [Candidatus Fluviicola riflensis]OGS77194.1 MAG: AMP-dependent synthetase [Candidatus Fluviicola riflensis]OGS82129.1 MAG: AMP-dependent synthetase [Fluviicola sp. RIFCSPHIGHO2_01_FULL_43_53]OGS87823.1 MAG: AMP-dependent synthetase [Fluviicola sp. RIFCSPHIGHO2_12_FULL_43_24]